MLFEWIAFRENLKLINHLGRCFVHEMEDGTRGDVASTSKSHAGSHHLQSEYVKDANKCFSASMSGLPNDTMHVLSCLAPKNEDAYEIAIPYEENNFEQQGFFNQIDQNFDGGNLLS